MNTLSLLPNRKKDRLEKLINFIFIKEILEVTLLIAVFISTLLLWSSVILSDQYTSLSQTALLISKESSVHNQENRKINSLIKQLNIASQNFATINDKIIQLTDELPKDIKLDSIQIDRQKNSFVISGTALTRDSLLSYIEIIKQVKWLKNIDTPTSQLFQRENINFELRANLNDIPALESIKNTTRNNSIEQ